MENSEGMENRNSKSLNVSLLFIIILLIPLRTLRLSGYSLCSWCLDVLGI